MDPDITLIAETNFRNQKRRFGIKKDDRRRHMYLIGKTGMGKSTMLENMIVSDINAGHGVAVVDPHGDLVEKIINYIPSYRVNDVIYFNPADMDYPIAFNPLESVDPKYKHLICSGLIAVFKKLWAESWGPRLEYLLRNAILALIDTNGTTLLGIMRILVDKAYRKKIIANIKDPVVKAFWVDEFSKYPDKFQVEAISPIQNKVGQFLSNFLIRNVVGQVKSSFNMREVMDNQKILLMNLSKGRIGEDTSSLLGAMMITNIQLAAMDRINIPEKERKDFYLYVDEFQNFATDSFASILSEARKYCLNLIIAHQYIEQLNEVVRPAVFGNVGTMVLFRIGASDAEELVKEFTPKFLEEDLVNIPKWGCYMKLMVDGIATDPFSATGLPPLKEEEKTGNREKVINLSRERYAEKREIVEEKIFRWSGLEKEEMGNNNNVYDDDAKQGEKGNNSNGEKSFLEIKKSDAIKRNADAARAIIQTEQFSAKCAICGKETKVNFKPDNKRSVFCKECFKKVKAGEVPILKNNQVNIKKEEKREERKTDNVINNAPKDVMRQEKKEEPRDAYEKPPRQNFCAGGQHLDRRVLNNDIRENLAGANAERPLKCDNKDKYVKKESIIPSRTIGERMQGEDRRQGLPDRRIHCENIDEKKEKNADEDTSAEISIFDAMKQGATDFRGRKIPNSDIAARAEIKENEDEKIFKKDIPREENRTDESGNEREGQKLHPGEVVKF
ncbi:MAG: type IV secretion system DNA-binding domain-containing protein [bacterium]